jgi:hypothetical protein
MEGFLQECLGQENEALVQIRLDIADSDLFRAFPTQIQNDGGFKEEYQRLAEQVLPKVMQDLKIGIAGQVTSLLGSEAVAMTLGRGLAARLATMGGIFTTIARSGVGQFIVYAGVGMVAWIGIEWLWDWIVNCLNGHNPTEQLTRQVEEALSKIEQQIVDGDGEAIAKYQRLRQQQSDEPQPENQAQFREQADQIEQSGALGLRFQLQRLHELQSRTRREALLRLMAIQGN